MTAIKINFCAGTEFANYSSEPASGMREMLHG